MMHASAYGNTTLTIRISLHQYCRVIYFSYTCRGLIIDVWVELPTCVTDRNMVSPTGTTRRSRNVFIRWSRRVAKESTWSTTMTADYEHTCSRWNTYALTPDQVSCKIWSTSRRHHPLCIDNRFRKYSGTIAIGLHYADWHNYPNTSVASVFNSKFN